MRLQTRYLLSLSVVLALLSCSQEKKKEAIAKRHCSACHLFPDPSMLPKETWQNKVLPEMAFRMGLDIWQTQSINEVELMAIINALPREPMVTAEEWKAIEEYYAKAAPDSLLAESVRHYDSLEQFSVEEVVLSGAGTTMLTMIEQDRQSGMIYVGTRSNHLYRLTRGLSVVDSLDLGGPPSDVVFNKASLLLTSMGIMDPNDQLKGSVIQTGKDLTNAVILADSLKRPVHLSTADLNIDGEEDLLVSAFGNFTGGLYAFEKRQTDYLRHAIHSFPGTRKTIVADFNDDGLPDIAALISQGDEHIALFTNRGDFRFSYRVLLKFPAVYGSSYFELFDFNSDGHEDILYTNGDNADFSDVLKPYHGVRIFMNDGKNQFSESWNFPMYGASMARALDFDDDGDADIAAISFFPDFANRPDHSFIYFENKDGEFIPSSTPMAAAGRWIAMETADVDHDGDTDIMLAALNFPTGVPETLIAKWQQNKVSMLLFRNNQNRKGDSIPISHKRSD